MVGTVPLLDDAFLFYDTLSNGDNTRSGAYSTGSTYFLNLPRGVL